MNWSAILLDLGELKGKIVAWWPGFKRRYLEIQGANGESISLWKYLSIWRAYYSARLRIHFAKRSVTARCPACGHTAQHKIEWVGAARRLNGSSRPGAVVHTCAICTAKWGEPPIVEAKAWAFDRTGLDELDTPPNHESLPPLNPEQGQTPPARLQ